MIEYADHGSLRDFFNSDKTPHTREELVCLWTSASKLFSGLEIIHNLDMNDHGTFSQSREPRKTYTVQGVHQDIKPENIFVFRLGSGTSYNYRFKIGDFGMSSTTTAESGSRLTRHPDNHSTKIYGAPELTHHHRGLDDVNFGATWEVDIWSLGCVLFDLLVWITCGSRGLTEFFELRKQETDRVWGHLSTGYSGCFHNGESKIEAIRNMMDLVEQRRRMLDDLSSPIGDFILKEMLRAKNGDRTPARGLRSRFLELLDGEDARRFTAHSGASPAHPSMTTPSIASPSTPKERTLPPRQSIHSFYTAHEDEVDRESLYHGPGTALTHRSPTQTGVGPRVNVLARVSDDISLAQELNHGTHGIYAQTTVNGLRHHNSSPTPPLARRPNPPLTSASPRVVSEGYSRKGWDHHREEMRAYPLRITPPLQESPGPVDPLASSARQSSTLFSPPIANQEDRRMRAPFPPNHRSSQIIRKYEIVTVQQVLDWLSQGKTPPLPDYDRAMREIKDREQVRRHTLRPYREFYVADPVQIFVIDDSPSMKATHWHDVVRTFKALASLAKKADRNGIDLILTSRPDDARSGRRNKTQDLVDLLNGEGSKVHGDACNMETSLGTVLKRVKDLAGRKLFGRTPKDVNVYIFTDVLWQVGDDIKCGVENPIRNLTKFMIDNGRDRTSVALQFIQFGDDELGEKRLAYLDDDPDREFYW